MDGGKNPFILELEYDITLSENSFNNKKDVEYISMLYKDEIFLLKDKKVLIVIIISEILMVYQL